MNTQLRDMFATVFLFTLSLVRYVGFTNEINSSLSYRLNSRPLWLSFARIRIPLSPHYVITSTHVKTKSCSLCQLYDFHQTPHSRSYCLTILFCLINYHPGYWMSLEIILPFFWVNYLCACLHHLLLTQIFFIALYYF